MDITMIKEKNIKGIDGLEGSRTKLPYMAPELDVYQYVVERGFNDTVKALSLETVSEITEQTGVGGMGENYHGEWF